MSFASKREYDQIQDMKLQKVHLKTHSETQRMKLSETLPEFVQYIENEMPKDPLIFPLENTLRNGTGVGECLSGGNQRSCIVL